METMAELRMQSREAFNTQPMRSQFLHSCLNEMMRRQRALHPEEVLQIQHSIEENSFGDDSIEKKP